MAGRVFVAAATALLAAASAVAAAPTVTANVAAAVLAKGVVKKLSSTGGAVTYVTGSASVLGPSGAGNNPNKIAMSGYFTGASATLVDNSGKGVVLTAGPVSNLQTGLQTLFSPTRASSVVTDDFLETVTINDSTYTSWANSITLQFNVTVPAGQLSGTYAFCTDRADSSLTNSYDLALVTIESNTFAKDNFLLVTDGSFSTEMSVFTRFGQANEGQIGTAYGLSSNRTRCLAAQTYTTSSLPAGNYIVRYTVANQNQVNLGTRSQQAWLMAAASVVTSYPDNYDPTTGGSLFTGVDDVNNNNVDTYCVFGSTSALDLSPGFRVEGVAAGASNLYCCALQGRMNQQTNKCEVSSCSQQVTSYNDFVNSQNTFRDCYAQCYKRSAYIGNDPFTNLGSAMSTLFDERTDPVSEYSGPAVTSGVTLPDGLYVVGPRTFAYRHGLVVFSDTASTTGISVLSAGVNYICQKRGVLSSPTSCTIGCSEITADFFATGSSAGARCFTNCYYLG